MTSAAHHSLAPPLVLQNVAILRYFNVIGSDPKNRVGEVPRRSLARFGRISAACFQAAKVSNDTRADRWHCPTNHPSSHFSPYRS